MMCFSRLRIKVTAYVFLLFAASFSCSKKDDTPVPAPYVYFDVPSVITNPAKGPQGMAKADMDGDGDIDFLVGFPRGYDLFAQRLPLAQGLSDLLNRQVDLIPEHELNRHLREHVLGEAVEL